MTMGALDDIASRSSWGAQYDDGDLNLSGLASEVFVHHTVTAHLAPTASVDDERAQMRSIEATGQSRFGHGISYNVLVFPSGRAYQGVSFDRRGAHTDGRNSTVRSICFVGNYEEHHPTPAALATAAAIYAEGKGKLWATAAPLRGHRDIKATACPGKYLYAKLSVIRTGGPKIPGGFMSALTNDEQRTMLGNVGEIETIVRQLRTKVERLESELDERRKLDLAHMGASAERERILVGAVEALAEAVGVEPGDVLARIEAKLDELTPAPAPADGE
jgi:hypothetical protein